MTLFLTAKRQDVGHFNINNLTSDLYTPIVISVLVWNEWSTDNTLSSTYSKWKDELCQNLTRGIYFCSLNVLYIFVCHSHHSFPPVKPCGCLTDASFQSIWCILCQSLGRILGMSSDMTCLWHVSSKNMKTCVTARCPPPPICLQLFSGKPTALCSQRFTSSS